MESQPSLSLPEEKITVESSVGDITLRSATEIDYDPDENVKYYDVLHEDIIIGDLDVGYDDERKQVFIDGIQINEEYRRKGLGKALYKAVLNLPLPSGEDPRREGYVHVTERHSQDAENVWQSLAREGLATKTDLKKGYVIK